MAECWDVCNMSMQAFRKELVAELVLMQSRKVWVPLEVFWQNSHSTNPPPLPRKVAFRTSHQGNPEVSQRQNLQFWGVHRTKRHNSGDGTPPKRATLDPVPSLLVMRIHHGSNSLPVLAVPCFLLAYQLGSASKLRAMVLKNKEEPTPKGQCDFLWRSVAQSTLKASSWRRLDPETIIWMKALPYDSTSWPQGIVHGPRHETIQPSSPANIQVQSKVTRMLYTSAQLAAQYPVSRKKSDFLGLRPPMSSRAYALRSREEFEPKLPAQWTPSERARSGSLHRRGALHKNHGTWAMHFGKGKV